MDSQDVSGLPPFLKSHEACKVLGIGMNVFLDLVRQNAIPGAFRLGRKAIRVNTQILLASLGTNEATGASWQGHPVASIEEVRNGQSRVPR